MSEVPTYQSTTTTLSPTNLFIGEALAAKYLGLQFGTLRGLRKKNQGPKWKKLGTEIKYLVPDLDEWKRNLAGDTFVAHPKKV